MEAFAVWVNVQLPLEADEAEVLKILEKLHKREQVDDNVKITLKCVELFSRPLSSLASGSSSSGDLKVGSVGVVLRHDFFVLTVQVRDGGPEERILFEKLAKQQCEVFAGTMVNVKPYQAVENEKRRLRQNLKGSRVPVGALYTALIKYARTYSLCTLNCWHYGHEIPKEIIRLALEDPDLSKPDKAHLRTAINSVEEKERPSVRDTLRLFVKPFSDRNSKTLIQFEMRAEGKWWAEQPVKFFSAIHSFFFD